MVELCFGDSVGMDFKTDHISWLGMDVSLAIRLNFLHSNDAMFGGL